MESRWTAATIKIAPKNRVKSHGRFVPNVAGDGIMSHDVSHFRQQIRV
jgi:hypothetical protein